MRIAVHMRGFNKRKKFSLRSFFDGYKRSFTQGEILWIVLDSLQVDIVQDTVDTVLKGEIIDTRLFDTVEEVRDKLQAAFLQVAINGYNKGCHFEVVVADPDCVFQSHRGLQDDYPVDCHVFVIDPRA